MGPIPVQMKGPPGLLSPLEPSRALFDEVLEEPDEEMLTRSCQPVLTTRAVS